MRDWPTWNAARTKAYRQRGKYDFDTRAMNRQQKRAYHASKRKTANKRGQAGAPAPVFADKKKKGLAKIEKYLTKGAEPAIEEALIEQPRPTRKRRSELQRLEENLLHV